MKQHLLIDADDTLWENNIYFERAFQAFCEFLNHSTLTPLQVRDALDVIELASIRVNGYGVANFGRNMVRCYHGLVEREISPRDAEEILEIARQINDHPMDIIEGVPETLEYLGRRHDLVLMTKGNTEEQQAKIERSGLRGFFRKAVIVREKDPSTYRRVVEEHELRDSHSWMVGNSPKSDINPALKAGIGAVYVPHPRTWHLEHQELSVSERLLVVEKFAGLLNHF